METAMTGISKRSLALGAILGAFGVGALLIFVSIATGIAGSFSHTNDVLFLGRLMSKEMSGQAARASEANPESASEVLERIEAIAESDSELSPVAREIQLIIGTAQELAAREPEPGPGLDQIVREANAIRDNDLLGMMYMAEVFGAAGQRSNFMDEARTLHARIMQCRQHLASLVVEIMQKDTYDFSIGATFSEQTQSVFSNPQVPQDTLTIKNLSGETAKKIWMVVTLSNKRGEAVSNLFTFKDWKPGEELEAICSSGPPNRETVDSVALVQLRVLHSTGDTGPLEIRVR
jgi:hypothetical protein